MEVAKLLLEYLKVMAWPLLIGIVSLGFRKSIRRLLEERLTEINGLGVSAKFEEKVEELAVKAAAILEASPVPPQDNSPTSARVDPAEAVIQWSEQNLIHAFQHARSYARTEPDIAIAFAWSRVTITLREAGQRLDLRGLGNLDSPGASFMRRLREIRSLEEARPINEVAPQILELYRIRNEALHDPRSKPSHSAALSFVDAAEDLSISLFRAIESGHG
ncbi:hypothetical protein [Planotetraspora mira]|uniref:Uncharacterized protein n=1 Tax=Planotetraspora mira TaxID=58121 RepID=A0A8J3U197_9ACTN|nr:hypothetical protein [Planotetraspora mira]GII34184.1 hypothetical protein Pmi06nite_76260 [Planotetraspora mira]